MPRLSVTVDHIATIRQARGGKEPDPVHAATLAELAGCHGVTVQLREDRWHIQDRDVYLLKQTAGVPLNLEIAPTADMAHIAADVAPSIVTLTPPRREERTAEGGLTVRGKERELETLIETFHERNIVVSLFVDPDIQQIKAASRTGASSVELHAGYYASASGHGRRDELGRLRDAAIAAQKLGLHVSAGNGLDYQNVARVAELDVISELIIGHAIIARAALSGMESAVRDMLTLVS